MYTRFYGFSEKPFNVTPDPKFLFLTESHRKAIGGRFLRDRRKEGVRFRFRGGGNRDTPFFITSSTRWTKASRPYSSPRPR